MKHLLTLLFALITTFGVMLPETQAQEVRLQGLSIYSEATPRHLMVARVRSTSPEFATWAGARLDWKSRSLTPVLGLSHTLSTRRRYSLQLRTEGEVMAFAPPQPALALGLGMGLLNQWSWRRVDMHLGARLRARTSLSSPIQATRHITGVWTLSKRLHGKHSMGIGVEAGEVRAATGNALEGVIQLSYGY